MPTRLNQTAGNLKHPDSPALRALKVLVVVMGVLIVAGTATVVIVIYNRIADRAADPGPAAFGTLTARIPAGHEVRSVATGDGTLLVHLQAGDGTASILVLDLETGAERGRVILKPEP